MSIFALDEIQRASPSYLAERYCDRPGAEWGVIRREYIVATMKLLKEKLGFRLFISMDAVDRLHLPSGEQNPRFEILYFVRNIERKEHGRFKVRIHEGEALDSIKGVYQGADWAERFVWDFYGVRFAGGSNSRILTYEGFQGHALRKDYPLRQRQGLIAEWPVQEVYRGPGTNRLQG